MFRSKEKKALEAKVDSLTADRDYYMGMAEKATKEKREAQDKTIKLNEDVKKLKKLVREQTQADMLVVALKAMGAIPDPEKLNYEKEMERYRNQLSSLQNMGMSGYQGRLGQSLTGGLFGGIEL